MMLDDSDVRSSSDVFEEKNSNYKPRNMIYNVTMYLTEN